MTQSLPPEAIAILLQRGDESLKLRDIVAARLLFERAALAGSGRAAREIGQTYDPQFLAQIGERALPSDAAKALEWYRRAAALGDVEAGRLLQK